MFEVSSETAQCFYDTRFTFGNLLLCVQLLHKHNEMYITQYTLNWRLCWNEQ